MGQLLLDTGRAQNWAGDIEIEVCNRRRLEFKPAEVSCRHNLCSALIHGLNIISTRMKRITMTGTRRTEATADVFGLRNLVLRDELSYPCFIAFHPGSLIELFACGSREVVGAKRKSRRLHASSVSSFSGTSSLQSIGRLVGRRYLTELFTKADHEGNHVQASPCITAVVARVAFIALLGCPTRSQARTICPANHASPRTPTTEKAALANACRPGRVWCRQHRGRGRRNLHRLAQAQAGHRHHRRAGWLSRTVRLRRAGKSKRRPRPAPHVYLAARSATAGPPWPSIWAARSAVSAGRPRSIINSRPAHLAKMGYAAIGFGPKDLRLPDGLAAVVADDEDHRFVAANVNVLDQTRPYRVVEVGGKKSASRRSWAKNIARKSRTI